MPARISTGAPAVAVGVEQPCQEAWARLGLGSFSNATDE
jgi:hypothetical protein